MLVSAAIIPASAWSRPADPKPAAPPVKAIVGFDADRVGKAPPGWKIEGTNQKGPPATWDVAAGAGAPSPPNVLALVRTNHDSANTFNLCWSEALRFQDGALGVAFKAIAGAEDQGGGPIWRVRDADNYYLCRANPLENNFRVYSVKGGDRKMLASANAEIAPGRWHTITVVHQGDHIRCALDTRELLDAHDATFPGDGGVGVWTKSDAVTSFDDLSVDASKPGGPAGVR